MGPRNFLKGKKISNRENFSRLRHRQHLTRNTLLREEAVKFKFMARPLEVFQVLYSSSNAACFSEEHKAQSAFSLRGLIDPHTEKSEMNRTGDAWKN